MRTPPSSGGSQILDGQRLGCRLGAESVGCRDTDLHGVLAGEQLRIEADDRNRCAAGAYEIVPASPQGESPQGADVSLFATGSEVAVAVGFAFRELKLVVEPGGAVGLAALLAGRIDTAGKNVVIVLSGGNVDADLFAKLIG